MSVPPLFSPPPAALPLCATAEAVAPDCQWPHRLGALLLGLAAVCMLHVAQQHASLWAVAAATLPGWGAWRLARAGWQRRALLIVLPEQGVCAPQWRRGLGWSAIEYAQWTPAFAGTTTLCLQLAAGVPHPAQPARSKAPSGQGHVVMLPMSTLCAASREALMQRLVWLLQAYRMRNAVPEPVRVFLPDNQRPFKLLALFIILMSLLALMAGVWGNGSWGLVLGALSALAVGLMVAGRAWDGRPVLSIVPERGLRSPQWSKGIGWSMLQEVVLQQMVTRAGAQSSLVLHLRPGVPWPLKPAWWRRTPADHPQKGRAFVLSLVMLRSHSCLDLFAQVQRHHLRYRALRGCTDETPRAAWERQAGERVAALENAMPKPWALYGVLALNVGVWLCAVLLGGMSPTQPEVSALYRWGGNSAWSVLAQHQYWRLFTATVLHAGMTHLVFNMVGLYSAGVLLNRFYGHARFALIYWGSALVGSALGLHFAAQQAVSVGASGAVFGVLGALVVVLLRNRGRLPEALGSQRLSGMVVFVLYALMHGFGKNNVDNSAHVGGLLAGMALAACLSDRLAAPPRAVQALRSAVAAALATGAVLALLWTASPAKAVRHDVLMDLPNLLQKVSQDLERGEEDAKSDSQRFKSGALSKDDFVRRLREQHLPALRRAQERFESIAVTGKDEVDASIAHARSGLRIEIDMLQALLDALQAPPQQSAAHERRLQALLAQKRQHEAQKPALPRNDPSSP